MDSPRIYFAGSIKGGRNDASLYQQIIALLNENYGKVLTEHIGMPNVLDLEKHQTDSDIYVQDYDWLTSADFVVAEVTTPSLGVGYELGVATEKNIPVLCLYRNEKLSSMILGNPKCINQKYGQIAELKPIFDKFFKKAL